MKQKTNKRGGYEIRKINKANPRTNINYEEEMWKKKKKVQKSKKMENIREKRKGKH